MLLASGFRRAAFTLTLTLALGAGCARWAPMKTHEVPTQVDSDAGYRALVAVAKGEKYVIVAEDAQAKRVRLEAHVSGSSASSKSFIDAEVAAGNVRLSVAGHLVRDGKVHKSLARELSSLEGKLKQRLGSAAAAPAPSGGVATAPPATALPEAWNEAASDPRIWGDSKLTCLPVKVPSEHQAALSIRLATGETADLQLSLAYAAEICRSPTQCKLSGGCPALGIGDPERVARLAQRLSKGELSSQATLLDGGTPIVSLDLSHHGSIVQAMSAK